MNSMHADFKTFWNIVTQVWNEGYAGIPVGQMLLSLIIFTGFMLLRRIVTQVILRRMERMAGNTKSSLDNHIVAILEAPIQLLIFALGVFFATRPLGLDGWSADLSDKLVRGLISVTIFWSLTRAVDPFAEIWNSKTDHRAQTLWEWAARALKIGFVILGTATFLEIWGIEVAPLIAGLGLFGVAVALGAQNLFRNLIAGALIIAEKRFGPGDWILAEGIAEGTVVTIGFRSTMIRRFDKAPVHVPNTELSDRAVTNFTAMTHRRIRWMIGVEYRTTAAQLREIRDGIESHILNSKEFAKPPEVPTFVRIDSFNDSSIDILIYCFTKTTNWGEWLKIKEAFALEIKRVVEDAGSSFAFPSQSIYVESMQDAISSES